MYKKRQRFNHSSTDQMESALQSIAAMLMPLVTRTESKRRLKDRFDSERRVSEKKDDKRRYVETVRPWFEVEMIVVKYMNGIVKQNIGLRPHFSPPFLL